MQGKLKQFIENAGWPRIIIALFLLALFIAAPFVGVRIDASISDTLVRVGMNGILVLAMVPMIQSGCGLNFGLPLGIIAGLLGAVTSIQIGVTGSIGFIIAMAIAVPIAVVLGWLYGQLLNRVKGSGTFVAQPKLLHESTAFLAGYYQEAGKQHRLLRTEVLTLDVQRAGKLGDKLAIPESAQLTRLVRRRRIEGFDDGKPVVYTTVYVPYALFPDMAQQNFTDTSFYARLEARGLKVCHASRVLEVVVPSPEVTAMLELSPFEPVIHVDSIGYDCRGRRVEYARSYYPAGSSRFLIEVDR